MKDGFTVLTLLIILTAVFSYINYKIIKLPSIIGVMLISLIFSLCIVVVGQFHPPFLHLPARIVGSIDFETLLMKIMLSFLLFAGAIHIDLRILKRELVPIISFATIGVLLSTAIVGILMYWTFHVFDYKISFIFCLLFGALISPTDPIAVLGILKNAGIPATLEMKISGEALFNDGVGVVVFISILEVATSGTDHFSIAQIIWVFLREAGGGILWGVILGYLGFYLLRSIDQYQVEVLITLAIVMGGYLLADLLHISGLLAMVVSGIIVGNKARKEALSATSHDYLTKFWELIDEILNAILFLLIGLEILVIPFTYNLLWIGVISVIIVLLARFISVLIPTILISYNRSFEKNMLSVLTWGGLRGGISVALALSLPTGMYRREFVSITYMIVVFSILVQGLTIGKLAGKQSKRL